MPKGKTKPEDAKPPEEKPKPKVKVSKIDALIDYLIDDQKSLVISDRVKQPRLNRLNEIRKMSD